MITFAVPFFSGLRPGLVESPVALHSRYESSPPCFASGPHAFGMAFRPFEDFTGGEFHAGRKLWIADEFLLAPADDEYSRKQFKLGQNIK